MAHEIPEKQTAVQLTGPDTLEINAEKPVVKPGPYQVLAKVETCGLCFSDLKLLKQFDGHPRKSEIISGIDLEVLKEVPSYVPGKKAAVPGHEPFVTIIEVGEKVQNIKPGDTFLIQADYRWLPTKQSNGAFGYNLEGALQQYVILDQRLLNDPEGESTLIPAHIDEDISRSAIALAEPWACVEDAYVVKERTDLHKDGQMLLVVEEGFDESLFNAFIARYGKPSKITTLKGGRALSINVPLETAESIEGLEDQFFNDVVYYGSTPETLEKIFPKIHSNGLLNIVTSGGKFGRDVETMVGRFHYGCIRMTGTTGSDPAEGMEAIPSTAEIRKGDKINVIGAGGPMGVMHVIRNLCQGVADITVFAGDLDNDRLAQLSKVAKPIAEQNGLGYMPYNSKTDSIEEVFDYVAIMAPVPAIVADAVKTAGKKAIINIFAGIPAQVAGPIDIDAYIEKNLYFIGTSGSTLDDMKIVLNKVLSKQLDTNLSVGAVCGLKSAIEGIRAVENRTIAGKIICYPMCEDLELTTLDRLDEKYPEVAKCLVNGMWTKQAEEKLLEIAGK